MPRKSPRDFGAIKTITGKKGKSYQAFYRDPDGRTRVSRSGKSTPVRHYAPHVFVTKGDAEAWLTDERRLISRGAWAPPTERTAKRKADLERRELTFGKYAGTWLKERRNSKGRPLAPTTRDKYRSNLENHILPTFEHMPLTGITRATVRDWYAGLDGVGHAARSDSYNLLRSILKSATEEDELIEANPAYVRNAGVKHTAHTVQSATLDELAVIVANIQPERALMVQLATWTTLRFGEITELRRSDVELGKDEDGNPSGWLHVRRGVTHARAEDAPDGRKTKAHVRDPKTTAGKRPVAIPSFLLPEIRKHLLEHAQRGAAGLLFYGARGGHLTDRTFGGREAVLDKNGETARAGWGWYEARRVAGRPDLFFHDLRHTGASMAGQEGASIAELMARLGHTTPSMAMHYQHATRERDAEIARRLSRRAEGAL
ncbi:MAG: tyrosine-type recombinase/integrase [Pseudonocardiaceae bacterium]